MTAPHDTSGPPPSPAVAGGNRTLTLDCVHCGLCLEQCPTYRLTGEENQSPRGRIYLMRALAEGRTDPTPALAEEMGRCLVCRACETVCPSGVRFAAIMEDTRSELRRRLCPSFPARLLRRLLLDGPLSGRGRLRRFAGLLRFYQRSGLRRLVRAGGLLRLLPQRLRALEATLPPMPPAAERRPIGRIPASGPPRDGGPVAILEGCVMSQIFGATNRSTARILSSLGFEVIALSEPACCGALHAHSGDRDRARALARRLVTAFAASGAATLVMNSAGCGAAIHDYPAILADDPEFAGAAADLASRTVDLLPFLLRAGFRPPPLPGPVRAAWDAPCHLLHGQRVVREPLDILRTVPGLELVPLPGSDTCCGAAGLFGIEHPETSDRILDLRLDELAKLRVDVLLTSNPGCLLQWRRGVERRGLGIRVEHPADLLEGGWTLSG